MSYTLSLSQQDGDSKDTLEVTLAPQLGNDTILNMLNVLWYDDVCRNIQAGRRNMSAHLIFQNTVRLHTLVFRNLLISWLPVFRARGALAAMKFSVLVNFRKNQARPGQTMTIRFFANDFDKSFELQRVATIRNPMKFTHRFTPEVFSIATMGLPNDTRIEFHISAQSTASIEYSGNIYVRGI